MRRAFRFATESRINLNIATSNVSHPSTPFIQTSFHFPPSLAIAKEDQGAGRVRTYERSCIQKRVEVSGVGVCASV